jgi:hypothetical protein
VKDNLQYVSGTLDNFDNCNIGTFTLKWIEEFIRKGGNEMIENTAVYWCLPRKNITGWLCLIENDSHIVAMLANVKDVRTLCLVVSETTF